MEALQKLWSNYSQGIVGAIIGFILTVLVILLIVFVYRRSRDTSRFYSREDPDEVLRKALTRSKYAPGSYQFDPTKPKSGQIDPRQHGGDDELDLGMRMGDH